jgi:tRNA(Ile)-lysidine synthase
LRKARIASADDPSNRDPRFTRVRLRSAMPALEREGLDAGRLALLARRARRADAAIEAAVDAAVAALAPGAWPDGGAIAFPAGPFSELSPEVALRLLGRAIARAGNEGPVELGKLEALHAALAASPGAARFRRTLAGAVVTRSEGRMTIERAPARRGRAAPNRP